jgi:hypothetical protein
MALLFTICDAIAVVKYAHYNANETHGKNSRIGLLKAG